MTMASQRRGTSASGLQTRQLGGAMAAARPPPAWRPTALAEGAGPADDGGGADAPFPHPRNAHVQRSAGGTPPLHLPRPVARIPDRGGRGGGSLRGYFWRRL